MKTENIKWRIDEEKYQKIYHTVWVQDGETLGNADIDEVMIDFTIREYDRTMVVDFDVYVKGIDTGYGYLEDGTPYDYKDGGKIINLVDMPETLEEFKVIAIQTLEKFKIK